MNFFVPFFFLIEFSYNKKTANIVVERPTNIISALNEYVITIKDVLFGKKNKMISDASKSIKNIVVSKASENRSQLIGLKLKCSK